MRNKNISLKKSFNVRSGETGNCYIYVQQSPLFIPEILCSFFEYLNVRSLKKCRLVCTIWNFYAPSELAKRERKGIELHTPSDLATFLDDFISEDGKPQGATNLISKISLNLELPIEETTFFKLIPEEEEFHKLVVRFFTTLGPFLTHLRLKTKENLSFKKFASLVLTNTPFLTSLNLRKAQITMLDSAIQDSIIPLYHLRKLSIPNIQLPHDTANTSHIANTPNTANTNHIANAPNTANSIEAYYDVWTSICPNVESFGCDELNGENSALLLKILTAKNLAQQLRRIPRPVRRNNEKLLQYKKYEALSLLWSRLNVHDFNDILEFNDGTLNSLEIVQAPSLFGVFYLPVMKSLSELRLRATYRFMRDLSFAATFPNLKIVKIKIPKEFNFEPIYDLLSEVRPLGTVRQLEISESGLDANMNIFAFSRVRFPNVRIFKLFSNGILLFREVRTLWRTWKNSLEELAIHITPDLSGVKRENNCELYEDFEKYFDGTLTGYDDLDLKNLNWQVKETGNFTEPEGTKYSFPSTYFPLTILNFTKLRKLTLRGIKGFEFPFISCKILACCNSLEEITIKTLGNHKIPLKAMNILKTSIRDVYYV